MRVREELGKRLATPVDVAPLVTFRILFGTLMLVATVRFAAHGWIAEHYGASKMFFPMASWVVAPGVGWLTVMFGLMGLSSIGVAIGFAYRPSALLFGGLFTYVHAIDKTYYLNHYYLITLLSFLLVMLPLDRAASVRTWRDPASARASFPTWMLWLVRFQIGCVYFFGGVAKLGTDWLLHAQPLTIWLARNRDVPLLGALFVHKWTAYAMSWVGLIFDLSTPFTLSNRRLRPYAYGAVLFFHIVTARLFQIGLFPLFMSAFALMFFPPETFRKLLPKRLLPELDLTRPSGARTANLPWWVPAYVLWQLVFPLRALLYPGLSIWTDEGFRYSWHVMLAEKNGYVEVTTVDKRTGERREVRLEDELTPLQQRQVAYQPDMLLQLAHHVRDVEAAAGRQVEVYVKSEVSLNGRPRAPLIDPSIDLAAEEDTWWPKRWIVPAPEHLEPRF